MRFKLDENLPGSLKDAILAAGHDCDTVAEEGLAGAADDLIYTRCQTEQRVLMTVDLDFADIRAYPPSEVCGLIVLRPDREDIASLRRLVQQALKVLDVESVAHRLWIVEERRIRIRE
ncbi:MAG: DUF5615 family PIN-like protein [Panacagrimonas sp.]